MGQIIDYDTLIAEVKNWINNSAETDDNIKGWIQLAESSLQRELATLDNEVTITSVPSSNLDPLPTGFNGLREAYIVDSPNKPLELISPAQLTSYGDLTGTPIFFSIEAGNFRFNPSASGYTVSYTYFKKLTPLSDGAPTNYLILEDPDVYLGATLAIAQKYLRDDIDASQMISISEAWIEQMKSQDKRRKLAGQMKRVGTNPVVGSLR